MPIYEITAPNGKVFEVTAPDGASEHDVLAYAQAHYQEPEAAPKHWQPVKRSPADLHRIALEHQDRHPVTEDMSGAERFAAGTGKSLSDTWQGLEQLAGAADAQDVDEKRRTDEALMNTPGGIAGNFAGSVAQVVGPGVVLKGAAAVPRLARAAPALTTAARGFLPTTIRGSAAQGAVIGGLQPVGTDDSRAMNTAVGAGLGTVGAALPRAVGATYRGVRGYGGQVTGTGVDRRLAEILRAEAANPNALMHPQPSAIPGVQRSLAEESLDPGIARLERNARSTGKEWDALDRTNNAARVQALDAFAGDSKAIRAAEAFRDKHAGPLLAQAKPVTGVNVAPVRATIDSLAKKNAPRAAVRNAIEDVRASLDEADDSIDSLYQVRKNIDDLLSGKAGADKSYAKAARKELMAIKDVLDQQMAARSPEFGKYLQAYRNLSKPIDRMRIGQELGKAGKQVIDPITGRRVLLPASFAKKAGDLDAVAAKATGFKRAKAGDYLQPEDQATVTAIADDLSRRDFAATAGTGGNSQTFERMALNDRLAGGLATRLPFVGKAFRYLETVGQQRLRGQLSAVLANPAKARAILASLSATDRRTVETALSRAGGVVGATAPAVVEKRRAP